MPKHSEQKKSSDNLFYHRPEKLSYSQENIEEKDSNTNFEPDSELSNIISEISNLNIEKDSEINNFDFQKDIKINNMALTVNDFIKDAQRIHEFRGDESYSLSSFIREVDTVLPQLNDKPDIKKYVFERVILNKIQGEALLVMRTLPETATWDEIKTELIKSFGVKESYYQLMQQAFSIRPSSVSAYYNNLQNILAKLNEKYCYDSEKPLEFSPRRNEDVILKTFLNNIDVNLASIIINKNVNSLRESYNLLENLGLIRERQFNNNNNSFKNRSNKPRSFQNNNNFGQNNSNFGSNFQRNFHNSNNNGAPYQSSQNFANNNRTPYQNSQNFSNQSRNNYQNNSNSFSNNFQNFQNFNQNNARSSGQTRRTNNSFRNFNRINNYQQPEPMEVDFVRHDPNFRSNPQTENPVQDESNFQLEPQIQTFR